MKLIQKKKVSHLKDYVISAFESAQPKKTTEKWLILTIWAIWKS